MNDIDKILEEYKEELLEELIRDLADNFRKNDVRILETMLNDVYNDALFISNRINKLDKQNQFLILKNNIKKAVKTIYLQRGTEDVKSQSQNGISNTYDNAIETMTNDIIKQNKRLLI